MLNYVDRQILALLEPTLEVEFRWSDQDYANMLSAFQVSAAVAFLGTGWFIDRVGLRLGFAIGVALWSVAGMAHAFATTVGGCIASRVDLADPARRRSLGRGWGYGPLPAICSGSYLLARGIVHLIVPHIDPVEEIDTGVVVPAH